MTHAMKIFLQPEVEMCDSYFIVFIFLYILCINKTAIISSSNHPKVPLATSYRLSFLCHLIFLYDIIHFSVQAPHSDDKKVLVSTMLLVVGSGVFNCCLLFAQSSVPTPLSLNYYILYENCILLKLFKHIRMMTIQ